MKKSINAWSVEGKAGFEEMFSQIHAAGFDGIELNVDAEGSSAHCLSLSTTDEELRGIRKLSEKYSLPVVSISSSLHAGMWGDADPSVQEKGVKVMRKQIACAKALDATGILMVPGGMNEHRTLKESWENSIRVMKQIRNEVASCGVKVDVENVWNGFFTSPFDILHFLNELDCDGYRVYFDAGNMIAFSWSEYWAEILGGHIDKVHVKDYKRNGGSINQGGTWCDILSGDVNWPKVIPALKKGGFDGYLTAEVGKSDPSQSWEDYYKMVAKQVGTICAMN